MFNITTGMEQAWLALGEPLAQPADIELIEGALGVGLPREYVEFVTRYGFVEFGRDPERRMLFSYMVDERGRRETRQDGVSFLFDPDEVVQIYRYMISTDDPQDESRPMIPPGYLTVGSNAGHSSILLDVATNFGQVLYWPESDWRWGTHDNLALGYVADSFEDFINGLRPDPL
ncbi:MAG: SMI1/KNR4 family protein [Betaproteobacteria bacterium]